MKIVTHTCMSAFLVLSTMAELCHHRQGDSHGQVHKLYGGQLAVNGCDKIHFSFLFVTSGVWANNQLVCHLEILGVWNMWQYKNQSENMW